MRPLILATVAGGLIAFGILWVSNGSPKAGTPPLRPSGNTLQAGSHLENRPPLPTDSIPPVDGSRRPMRTAHSADTASRPLVSSRGLGHPRMLLRLTFRRLSSANRSRAIELALRLPSSADRKLAIETLAREFLRTSGPTLRQLANGSLTTEQCLGLFLTRGPLSPLLVTRIAAHEPADSPAVHLASRAVSMEAQSNPARAFALSRLLPAEAGVKAVAEGWARTAPRAAASWVLTIEDPSLRTASLSQLALTTATRDAAFAASLVSEMPSSAQRDEAMAGVVRVWAQADTEAAMQWAESLPKPAESQAALAAIRSVAPSGIGIALSRPQNSPYPTAMQLVPNSPASKSGGIRAGDSIVAVSDSSGGWTSTQGRQLDAVVGLLRGDPGRPVQIQVLPAGATDPSHVQTVTLTREQLLFKRPQPGLPDA